MFLNNNNNFDYDIENTPRFIIIGIVLSIIIYALMWHFLMNNNDVLVGRAGGQVRALPIVLGFLISYILDKILAISEAFGGAYKQPFEINSNENKKTSKIETINLINENCKIFFSQNKQKIICKEKIITANGYCRNAVASHSGLYNINAVYENLVSIFDDNTNYDVFIETVKASFCDIAEQLLDIYGQVIDAPSEIITREQNTIKIKIDINNCSKADLITLPYLNEELAEKIMRYKRTHIPFESIDSFFRLICAKDYQKLALKDKIFIYKRNDKDSQHITVDREVDI